MSERRKVRIGIDVGGTFTHAVAIDAATLALAGKSKVPTTHTAAEGVARGVVDSLLALLQDCRLAPADVLLIAHSTTQATNALLEGDVAPVGILGMGRGAGAWLARRQTALKPMPLAPGRELPIFHRFIASERVDAATVTKALEELRRAGAEVIVAAEAFAVDDPRHEQFVCDLAARRDLPATATHHVSRLHGLGVRTRTAVINASMLPRMLATANLTEQAVRQAGVQAPVMIMRSDGGVMDIAEMRRRPILTMLSGPAAGVAAALLYARVSDGVFLEVGGTSTDISVIKNGRCQMRSAEVGGQKLHVSTLDVRTVGVAGGSLVRLCDGKIAQVGPRSSHIAGLPYLSFAPPTPELSCPEPAAHGETWLTARARYNDDLSVPAAAAHAPARGDARTLELAFTPTCASNRLGLVPEGDPARGNRDLIDRGFDQAAAALHLADGAAVAAEVLRHAAPPVVRLVEGLIRDYKLDRGVIRLVGGGGGASAIVPYVARVLGLPHENVLNADVISAIGVALALVRDSIERTVVAPTEEDIRRIREEAFTSVLKMGAAGDTIEVFVEVDAQRNLLRATAEGATEIRRQELQTKASGPAERRALVQASLGRPAHDDEQSQRTRQRAAQESERDGEVPQIVASGAGFEVWAAELPVKRLWGLVRERRRAVRVLDRAGAIRWASNHADARASTAATAEQDLEVFAERYTRYSDAGATIPRCFVLLASRIIDLSGLIEMTQVREVLRIELRRHPAGAECVLLLDVGGT